MRKSLFVGVLAIFLAAVALFPFLKSDAAYAPGQKTAFRTGPKAPPATLPNYDVRLDGKGEFKDYDLNSPSGLQSAAEDMTAKIGTAAVDEFRASLNPEDAGNLRAVVNEAGALKNFFIYGATLSEPQSDTPDNIARGFLTRHASLFALSRADVGNLALANEDLDGGTAFLKYVQTIGGIKVFEGGVQVVVNKYGEVLSVRQGFLVTKQAPKLEPTINETDGIAQALAYAGREVDASFAETYTRASMSEMSRFGNPLGPNRQEILSELNVVRVGNTARLAWHIYTDVGPNEWYETLVDAHTGELLLRFNLYAEAARGTVFRVSPSASGRSLVSFIGDTTINTANGWMNTYVVSTGNNVEAYLDTDGDNSPDVITNANAGLVFGHAFAPNQDFTFPFSTAVDPRTQQAAVLTNLFYFNNVMHDFSYGLGFTETAGNFQSNNYGRGGADSDSVIAEAQDSSASSGPSFATPPDGQRPRMQQFLFTTPNPDRDSSLDSDLVYHEYGHGISNRLIGNGGSALSGTQSQALGEGWSDYWAITFNNDGAVGEYTSNNANGVRRAVYSVPASGLHNSYADLGSQGFVAHLDGEVWAATLWDLRAQLGRTTTDRLVLNGMKFTPIRPSFLEARDGILQADLNLNAGANRCAIWTVFARHGMGASAVGNDGTTHTAATNLPVQCGGACTFSLSPTSASPTHSGGPANVTVTAAAGCNWTAVSNAGFITITAGSSGSGNGIVNFSVATNTSNNERTGTMTIGGVSFTVTQAGFNAVVNPGFENGTAAWVLGGSTARSTGAFPHDGVGYMTLGATDNSTSTLFQTVLVPASGGSLTFWMNITTNEAAGAPVFDRCFIEVVNTSGTLILAPLVTFSNQNSGSAGNYIRRGPFSLNAFAGQSVRIQFRATNDSILPTTFRLDDVLVQ